MLWDLIQQGQISGARSDASSARSAARDAAHEANRLRGDVTRLQTEVDRLSLACTAMWELLRETGRFSDEQLRQRIEEVDLRDGVLDGKLRKDAASCTDCGRPNGPRRNTCLYCGAELRRGGGAF